MGLNQKMKEYLKRSIDELITLPKEELKRLLEQVFLTLEKRIQEKEKNNPNISKHLDTLNAIKYMAIDEKFLNAGSANDYKLNTLKGIFKIWKNIVLLTSEEKVQTLMEYTENHNIPLDKEKNFSQIKEDIFDETSILEWYTIQIQQNLQEFEKNIQKYKSQYPEGYKKLKISSQLEPMIKCFMKYTEENPIPVSHSNLTFGDIGSEIKKNSKIGSWVRNNLSKNYQKFLIICEKYKDTYPKAYSKINNKFEKYHEKKKSISLGFDKRLEIVIKYLENNNCLDIPSDLTFKSIEPNCQDLKNVKSWLSGVRNNKLEELLEQCELYKDKYPIGYNKIITRINTLKENKDKINLTEEEMIKIYIKYIDNHDLPTRGKKLKFMDIEDNVTDERKVYEWANAWIFTTMENVLSICVKYEKEYPNACQKLKDKMQELQIFREKTKYNLSPEEKIEVFMKYINKHPIPTEFNDKSFCEIDPTIKDTCKVGAWIRDRINREGKLFCEKCLPYKDIYPNAYKKITKRIQTHEHKLGINSLVFEDRVKVFMEYYNKIESYYVEKTLRFCDLDPVIEDETAIQSWIRRNLEKNSEKTLSECSKYAAEYPKAYEKILFYYEDLMEKQDMYSKKILAFLKYVEENGIPNLKEKIIFKQLDSSISSSQNITYWFNNRIDFGQRKFISECHRYKDNYPKAIEEIETIVKNKNSQKKKQILKYQDRIKILMNYLETNNFKTLKNLRFCDLKKNVKETANIGDWIRTQIYSDLQRFITEYTKYKEEYPIAYQKLDERIKKYSGKKQITYLTQEQKVPILMQFLENNNFNNTIRDLRFCDITEFEDDTVIYGWYSNSAIKKTFWLSEEIKKYRNTYPTAYLKICNYINSSQAKLKKQRLILIEKLKEIKNNLSNPTPAKIKKRKI